MNNGIDILRSNFEAQTDIVIEPYPEHWKTYAMWLEKLAVNELNCELEKENEILRNRIQEAINILKKGLDEKI